MTESNINRVVQDPNKLPRSKTPYLDRYTTDLTAEVAENVDKYTAYGRESEMKKVISSLNRINKNSPCLVGKAGVGKTAIVEGFCVAIVKDDVPEKFKNKKVRVLNLSAIQSQTKNSRGDIEGMNSKMEHIINELKQYKDENILFIDEVHTIMGSGATEGGNLDVANTLKPALSRGSIYLISATTRKEFTIIQKDAAMERRLQEIEVKEVDRDAAISILTKIAPRYQKLLNVFISEGAIEAAVDLSIRFMANKQLPDKAIDLMDEAASIASLENMTELTIEDIGNLIHDKRGVPLSAIRRVSSNNPINIEDEIKKVVKGQDRSIKAITDKLYLGMTGLQNQNRVLASALLLGMSGVGKTEIGKQIASSVFGDSDAFFRLDCSEFKSDDAIPKLIGDNKTGRKGVLTEAVSEKPYQLVLVDELEKAHPDFLNLFLQVLDDGRLTNAEGDTVDFTNVILIGTSNVGHQTIRKKYSLVGDFSKLSKEGWKSFKADLRRELEHYFRPEFLNRWGVIEILNLLTEEVIESIVSSKMLIHEKNLLTRHHIKIEYIDGEGLSNRDEFYTYLKSVGTDPENGARPLERQIEEKLLSPIAKELYFTPRTDNDWFKAVVQLTGESPLSNVNSDGRVTLKDKRVITIHLEKIDMPYIEDSKSMVS